MTDLTNVAGVSLPRLRTILGYSVALTSLAELFYFIVWGVALFPMGDLAGKAIWTATCGVAMGAVTGAAVLLLVESRMVRRPAIAATAMIVFVVGSYCAWLCSRIDLRFGYFGGAEHSGLFILGGVVPALAGGLLLGWLLYGRATSAASTD